MSDTKDVSTPKESTRDVSPNTPAAANDQIRFTNTNKWDTRTMVTMALMCTIAVLLSFIEFPIIPTAPFLKLDVSIMPSMVCGFAFGTGAGCLVGVLCALIHGLIMGDWIGAMMNVIVTVAMVAPSAAIYRRHRTFKGGVAGLIVSSIGAIAAAIVANLLFDQLYGIPFDTVIALIVPALLPFNIIKMATDSVLTLIIYKSISNLITPKKKQVKGR